jgi:hypothetical protein
MTIGTAELNRIVLEAVSEDFQSFESVVRKLSSQKDTVAGTCDLDEIQNSLLSSVTHHLIGAYLLHADPPYATAVPANIDSIRTCWFFITEEGKEYLRSSA